MKFWKSLSMLAAFMVFGMLATVGLESGLYAQGEAEVAGGAGALIFFCVCWGAALLIPVAMAVFVYMDASKNGVDNGVLWAIVTFFTGLIGILIYFLVIKKQHMEKQGK